MGYIHKQKSDDYSSVAVLCQEDLAESLLKHLCTLCAIDELDLVIDYINFDVDDYSYEYGVVISICDGELHLSIEKARCEDGDYKLFDMDYTYVSKNCSRELLVKQTMYEGEMDVFSIENAE